MQSGLTRSTSQQQGSSSSRPSPANRSYQQRYISPGSHQRIGSNSSSNNTSAVRHIITTGISGGGSSEIQSHGSNGHQHHQQQQQQQLVTVEEFLQLKRALDRERGLREEADTRLREEIFELKDVRRREKLDATVAFASAQPNFAAAAAAAAAAASAVGPGVGGVARFPIPAMISSSIGDGSANAGGNSILARLHRVELYTLQMLPQQLEAMEERLRTRCDERSAASADAGKSDVRRTQDKIDALNKEVTDIKSETVARSVSLEASVAQINSTLNKTSSQIEILHTHRVHDEDTRQRIEHELQAHHNFVKEVEGELRKAQDATTAAVAKFETAMAEVHRSVQSVTAASSTQEASMVREVDRRMTKEREELREFVQSRLKPVESLMAERSRELAGELAALPAITKRLDGYELKLGQVEDRVTTSEASSGNRVEDLIKQLELRIDATLTTVNATNHARIKELTSCLEAQIADKISGARDEIDDAVAQQIQDIVDRVDEVARQDAQALQQQQQYVRSLVEEMEQGNAVASLLIDSTEMFLRDMRPEHASGYASCLEKISSCRSTTGGGGGSSDSHHSSGPCVADAVKVLYQTMRTLAGGVNSLREDVSEMRSHIGIATALSNVVVSPARH